MLVLGLACDMLTNSETSSENASWKVVYRESDFSFLSVFFINEMIGFVVGYNGVLLKTVDGGSSWNRIDFPQNGRLHSIFFLDKNCGFVSCDSELYYTDDGGNSWNIQLKIGSLGSQDFLFTSPQTGFMISQPNNLFLTQDGGRSWSRKEFPRELYHLSMVSDSIGYAVGFSEARTIRVINSLIELENMEAGIENFIRWYDVSFVNEELGWALGLDIEAIAEVIIHTSDGGLSWTIQATNLQGLQGGELFFIDESHGWAVGGGGGRTNLDQHSYIWHTNNGGQSWKEYKNDFKSRLTDVHFINKIAGWAVGYNGVILKLSN